MKDFIKNQEKKLKEIIPNLKKVNSLVRISIDSMNENTNKIIRPSKNKKIKIYMIKYILIMKN